eukprot:gene22839-1375_t
MAKRGADNEVNDDSVPAKKVQCTLTTVLHMFRCMRFCEHSRLNDTSDVPGFVCKIPALRKGTCVFTGLTMFDHGNPDLVFVGRRLGNMNEECGELRVIQMIG